MNQSEYKTIIYGRDDEEPRIAYITLNRPDKSNSISIGPSEMTGELMDAISKIDTDDGIKVVILKAAGKNFSAGFDLSMVYRVYGGGPGVRPHQNVRLRVDEDHVIGLPKAIFNCKKVTIAQVHGWCIEAGLWLAELCDITIADEAAKFAHRGQRLAFGGVPIPFELMSGHTKKHIELLITGRSISGQQAEEMGMITKAVPADILEEEVYNLARAICLIPLDAIAFGKMSRKHTYDGLGVNSWWNNITYHTLSTNITYRDDEKESLFLRDREKVGETEAFHKLNELFENALNKTTHFRSYFGK